jgi:hypothetical protein
MGNYLFIEPVVRYDMEERVSVGINHVTVVPENAERSTHKESRDGRDDEE